MLSFMFASLPAPVNTGASKRSASEEGGRRVFWRSFLAIGVAAVAWQEIEGCAIWGMPVIEVWRSKKVIFCKRSMGGGATRYVG